jgi:uncharacterized repeat protein (TIGR03837 family)
MARPLSWDVFCRVVDNYGDAAVCWRLASQLAGEHGARVRLWIDDPGVLEKLRPAAASVEVRRWSEATGATPATVAIDAFDSGLPDAYAQRMDARSLWIKLEYLSAEPWVDGHHGLPSPHPTLPVRRYFFFPGFTERTGGLLREADLFARRDAFDAGAFWKSIGMTRPASGTTVVSLFGYENPALPGLLSAWSRSERPTLAILTGCPLARQAREVMRGGQQLGNLNVRYLDFMAQPKYDELLWSCDWNFVRGEDSFVRAQWAARPFAWQAYPQPGGAHHAKVTAFLDRYCGGLEAPLAPLWKAWNGMGGDVGAAWDALAPPRPALDAHARRWAGQLAARGELAGKLADFAENLLK